MNIWVYEAVDKGFAGVELQNPSDSNKYGLEKKEIRLEKYAYHKHVGPDRLIKQTRQEMTNQLIKQGNVFEIG